MKFYPVSTTCQIANLAELYERQFGKKTDGTFVEVGSHDGYSWSNVWGLAEIGWKGMCYEPIAELFEKCRAIHRLHDVVVSFCCVGDKDGVTKLYLNENPTIDEETVEKSPWGDRYLPDNYILSPVITLNTSLQTVQWPHEFDVLSIDVEGAELQVLRGIDLEVWKPQMIILETHEGNPDIRRTFHVSILNEYMATQPYTKIQVDGLNTIYWRKQ
jgi:FkbM family methyltransferase